MANDIFDSNFDSDYFESINPLFDSAFFSDNYATSTIITPENFNFTNDSILPECISDGTSVTILPSSCTSTFSTSPPMIKNFGITGAGTSANPYVLRSLYDLEKIGTAPYNLNLYYKLGNDIDASDTSRPDYNAGAGWLPRGTLTGQFDGDNKTISGLYINRPTTDNVGLFDSASKNSSSNSKIHRLIISNCDITGKNYVGAVVGFGGHSYEYISINGGSIKGINNVGGVLGGSTRENGVGVFNLIIENSNSSATITAENNAGGILGGTNGYNVTGRIWSCSFSGTISGKDSVGGIVGFFGYYYDMGNKRTIKNCIVTGNVTGISSSGGISGRACGVHENCIVKDCIITTSGNNCGSFIGYPLGYGGTGETPYSLVSCKAINVNVSGIDNIGGLVGFTDNLGLRSYIYKTTFKGNVQGRNYVGGLIGLNQYSNSGLIMEQCSSQGNLISTGSYSGGVTGYSARSTISNSYSKMNIAGSTHVGGFSGRVNNTGYTNCYSIGMVSGSSNVGGFSGSLTGTPGTVTSCYWDVETSEQSNSANGTGKTSAEMINQATYSTWDFTTPVWIMDCYNEAYPYLLMEGVGSVCAAASASSLEAPIPEVITLSPSVSVDVPICESNYVFINSSINIYANLSAEVLDSLYEMNVSSIDVYTNTTIQCNTIESTYAHINPSIDVPINVYIPSDVFSASFDNPIPEIDCAMTVSFPGAETIVYDWSNGEYNGWVPTGQGDASIEAYEGTPMFKASLSEAYTVRYVDLTKIMSKSFGTWEYAFCFSGDHCDKVFSVRMAEDEIGEYSIDVGIQKNIDGSINLGIAETTGSSGTSLANIRVDQMEEGWNYLTIYRGHNGTIKATLNYYYEITGQTSLVNEFPYQTVTSFKYGSGAATFYYKYIYYQEEISFPTTNFSLPEPTINNEYDLSIESPLIEATFSVLGKAKEVILTEEETGCTDATKWIGYGTGSIDTTNYITPPGSFKMTGQSYMLPIYLARGNLYDFVPGCTINFSGNIKANSKNTNDKVYLSAYLVFFDKDENPLFVIEYNTESADNNVWYNFSEEGVVPEGVAYARIGIQPWTNSDPNASGWIDDIKILQSSGGINVTGETKIDSDYISADYDAIAPSISCDYIVESVSCESDFSAITPTVSCGCTADSVLTQSNFESAVPSIQCSVTTEAVGFSSLYDYLSPNIRINALTYALTQTSTYTSINPLISTSVCVSGGISNSTFTSVSPEIKCSCVVEMNPLEQFLIETQTPDIYYGYTITPTTITTQYESLTPSLKIDVVMANMFIYNEFNMPEPHVTTPPSQVYRYTFIFEPRPTYRFIIEPKKILQFIMEDQE